MTGQCSTGSCTATICPQGCCSAQGMCLNYGQQSNAACGTSGASACQPCSAGSCQNGVCGSWMPATCPQGCCSGSGQCLAFAQQSNTVCGTGGNLCQACANGFCQNGVCSATCDTASCLQGCCLGTACTLFAAQSTSKCGTNANTCQTCGYQRLLQRPVSSGLEGHRDLAIVHREGIGALGREQPDPCRGPRPIP